MEVVLFYCAAACAVAATALVVTRTNAAHALVYLIVSLLAIAVTFYLLGAAFAAVLQVVIYAGAIMVLFLFVVMMLNLGRHQEARERTWLQPGMWLVPGLLSLALFLILTLALSRAPSPLAGVNVTPKAVGLELFTGYVLAVELSAILLLAALVGAFHLGRHYMRARREEPEA
ncbi:MAG: NADH-quinone oxidoreductase subunit J [Pseudomonadales bacterium]|jgi:NADH-quinone oxidoreductase subunit J|nr:NADH-quinone oxidoreductase subunit J [Pseudomonadales bacterium]